MRTGLSRTIFCRLYGRDIYEEPFLSFMPVVREHLAGKSKRILDAACGSNNPLLADLLAAGEVELGNIVGLDIDQSVRTTNKLHRSILIQDLHDPISGHQFDAVISLYTWEHLERPEAVLVNFHEVLAKDGVVIIIAPQRFDYVSTIERILPKSLKNLAWQVLKGKDKMPYPAFFRLCTRRSLGASSEEAGFVLEHYRALSTAPIWFTRAPPLFVLACSLMSLFNRFALFEDLRSTFIAVLAKR